MHERLSGYKIREYEILKKAGELPEGRTLREHIGLPAPDEDLPQLAALLAAGKMPDRQNADGTLTRGKPITADVLDSMISDVQKTYGKVAPEESARTIKKLRMMKAVNFDKGRPLGGGANEVADTRQHATY